MSDSEEYGDDFDDSAFLEAATQVEKENTPPFQPSPRPTKRRKIGHQDERRTIPIPPRQRQSHRSFIESDDSEESDYACVPSTSVIGSKTISTHARRASRRERGNSQVHDDKDGETGGDSPRKNTIGFKRKERIHVSTSARDLTDVFQTQPSLEHSPPWKPRGARWQKPSVSIGVHRPAEQQKWTGLNPMKTMALPGRESISSRPTSRSPEKTASPIDIKESPRLPTLNATVVDYDPTEELAGLPSDAFTSSSSSPQKQDGDEVTLAESRKRIIAPQTGLRQTTLFGRMEADGGVPPSQVNKRYNFIVDQKEEPPTHHKLDSEAIKTWVYPTNLGTIRDYQFNIVARGLFHNLLVALPTGLGKTFIAATIMLNWFRWTTESQIVFVAPTKPLVSQQIEACFNIVGIPRSSTTMLIGGVSPALRAEEWASKRVFFMTPQTLLNDLKSGYADPKKIVLLVVDEAHRATGSYAYVEVVSFLRRFNQSFRVLALTATPGSDVEAVQKVIDGLDISRVEIRTENSLDIRNFVHQRTVEKHVFTNSDEMEMCMDLYSQALQPSVNKIAGFNAFWSKNPLDITPYGCTRARQKWYQEAGRHAHQGQKAIVNAIFTILGSISQGMELLKYHGIGPFYTKLKSFKEESERGKSKYKKEILESDAFKKLMVRLHTWITNDDFIGHPKLEFLQQVILDHFVNAAEGRNPDGAPPAQTRIMVFAHFRDSAEEIVRVLRKHQPMIRPRVFVGQSTAKNSDGMDQKEQLEVIEKFKMGTYNTLVATSIGEEGLDIGEVDLIICYDSKASPIRMLQRMGRTGRKREGKIVMLQMKGKEENDAEKAKDNYQKMQELIAEGSRFTFHDEISRRILPRDVQPIVDKRVVDIPVENSQSDWLPEPKKKGRQKKPPKKFHMPDGVITGFVTAGNMDQEIESNRCERAVTCYTSDEILQLPPLDTILLDEQATKDLERRYQTVTDDNDVPIIGELDFSAHIAQQRILSRTKNLPSHGHVTKSLVRTLQRMHAMDNERLEKFKRNLHYSDCESETGHNIIVSDTENCPAVQDDMWADDDPASQEFSRPKAKPVPKPRAKTTLNATNPISRPHKDATVAATTKPARKRKSNPKAPEPNTPRNKTPDWQVSAFAGEGASSSPPPTDPRMRIASQAETIGSDDTIGEDEYQDTQAYLMDSELASFIVEDNEDIDVPDSSLPSLDFGGLGKGTQAVVRSAMKLERPRKAAKIFSSDPTDDDAVVSSDRDDDMPPARMSAGAGKHLTFVVESASEDENDDIPIVPRKRARRVIDDDDDDDDE